MSQSDDGKPLDREAVESFVRSLHSALIEPHDPAYDTVRKVWNGMIDKRPALIARCQDVTDVVSSVNFARTHGLLVAVRGGGHNVAGNAVCDGGLMIDLSLMKDIQANAEARTARAQGGVTWGEFDSATQAHGLATTGGLVSSTGIAGFTLGGGIGWLMRQYGLTCDNLLSADVVTAEGRFLKASADENADLFWGIRGGGGNYGIVTTFEYRLHPVGPLLGGMMLFPLAQAGQILRSYREYVTTAPDELTTMIAFITAPPAPFLPQSLHGTRMVAIALCYHGPIAEGQRAIQPLRAFGSPAADLVSEMAYGTLQTMFDASSPAGLQNYWKSEYLAGLPDAAIDTLVSCAASMTSPMTAIHLHHLQGAISRVSEDEMAFSHRDAPFALNLVSMWADPAENERHIRWTRDSWAAIRPFSAGGVYVNFLGEEGEDRIRAAYGPAKYERLVALKDKYDPTNFFRLNQNIRPTTEERVLRHIA